MRWAFGKLLLLLLHLSHSPSSLLSSLQRRLESAVLLLRSVGLAHVEHLDVKIRMHSASICETCVFWVLGLHFHFGVGAFDALYAVVFSPFNLYAILDADFLERSHDCLPVVHLSVMTKIAPARYPSTVHQSCLGVLVMSCTVCALSSGELQSVVPCLTASTQPASVLIYLSVCSLLCSVVITYCPLLHV